MKDTNGWSSVLGGERQGFATLRVEKREDTVALFANAFCEEGLDPDRAILTRPCEDFPTGDYVAIHNHSTYWCRPFFGSDYSALPERVQGLLVRRETGWLYLLPVCGDTYKTVISGRSGGFELVTYSNCSELFSCDDQPILVMGEGRDPYALVYQVAREAATLAGSGRGMRKDHVMPEMMDYLGWCSWDAFAIRVSHEGLLEKAREFREKKVPVHFAILDDMWGDAPDLERIPSDADFRTMVKGMHASRLRTFEGAPDRFPQGVAAAIADLKAEGIPSVGLWFPTTGYWKGWEPDGEAREMPELLALTAEGRLTVIPKEEPAKAYFDRLCRKARDFGADFVKIDNQGFLAANTRDIVPLGQAARAIQGAIDKAAERHFGGALINCMGMPSECMFHRPRSAVSRCSDDFMPESPAWFSKNILQCSYNGLLQGQYYINDWDMWWTDDEQALKNSVCRAISGGPIYVSDKLGRTRAEVLLPLCFSDGRLLRCEDSAVPTEDCLVGDPTASGKIFKIFNRVGKTRILAAFDIDAEGRSVSGSISPSDVGLNRDCVVYEYFSGAAFVLGADESLSVTLRDVHDLRLYIFIPKEASVTPIGRTDKFISPAAIVAKEVDRITLYEGGEFAFFCEAPIRVFAGSRELSVERVGSLCKVHSEPSEVELRFVGE
ncbi:MAG: hypothetical protein IKA76_04100 [Clostridia bacterium]|nr:hypothetical protein [Clostridia bacterium]